MAHGTSLGVSASVIFDYIMVFHWDNRALHVSLPSIFLLKQLCWIKSGDATALSSSNATMNGELTNKYDGSLGPWSLVPGPWVHCLYLPAGLWPAHAWFKNFLTLNFSDYVPYTITTDICDQASKNWTYVHILIFEKYQFELFNVTKLSCTLL